MKFATLGEGLGEGCLLSLEVACGVKTAPSGVNDLERGRLGAVDISDNAEEE